MKRFSVLVSFMLLVLHCALAQSNYPVIVECSMHSDTLACDKNYCIYLPPSYGDESKSFPVLYLLHGLTDNNTAWRDKGAVENIATKIFADGGAQEMIIVMPDAGTTYDGYFNCDGWHYESFFFSEFIPYIEGKYRIKADKAHRAIAGLSMGGGGTTGYALRHSEMFSSAYAMSALMGMVENTWISRDPDPRRRVFMQSAVDYNNIAIVENSDRIQRDGIASVRWFIDVGDDDFLFDNNMDFIRAMRKQRISYQLRVRDGGHTWQYWQEALYIALPFISEGFGSDVK